MALFKSKAKSKVDELLELFNDLNDEELEEFIDKADLDGDGTIDEEDTETEGKEETTDMTEDEKQIAEAKEDAEKKGEEPTKSEIDESVGEQEHLDGDKDSQDAKDRVDESEGMKKADEEKAEEKHNSDMNARIDKLETMLVKIIDMLTPKEPSTDKELEEKKAKYGMGEKPVVDGGNDTVYDEKKINQLLGR